jgi:hypothetical protein
MDTEFFNTASNVSFAGMVPRNLDVFQLHVGYIMMMMMMMMTMTMMMMMMMMMISFAQFFFIKFGDVVFSF